MQTNPFIMESGDYLAYVHYYRYRQTWATRIIMFGTLALLLLSGLVVFLLGLVEYVGIFLFMAAVLAVYFFIVLGYLLPHWGYALAKGRGDYGKPCTVVINETHVGATSETVDLKKPWNSMESIVVTRRHVFICFNKCNAFIIPKTAFDTPAHAEAFVQSARTHLAAAKGRREG